MDDSDSSSSNSKQKCLSTDDGYSEGFSPGEGGNYWKLRHDNLLKDYEKLQVLNQALEERLLTVVEVFEKKKDELVANVEYEKSTLMADVNKLSTKLVDARIKLHDYEEKELLHASNCNAPCHKGCPEKSLDAKTLPKSQSPIDPNLV